jgi:hypothetical protein
MKLTPRVVLLAAVGISALLIALAMLWQVDSRRAASPPPAATPQQAASPETPALSRNPAPTEEGNQREVTLFFLSPDSDDLVPSPQNFLPIRSLIRRQTVKLLIGGPETPLLPRFRRDGAAGNLSHQRRDSSGLLLAGTGIPAARRRRLPPSFPLWIPSALISPRFAGSRSWWKGRSGRL